MEDLKRAIALLFKRKGRDSLTEKEFVFSASMDLRWFPPKGAQKLLEAALRKGLLSLEEGKLLPKFELDEVDVSMDFRPTDDLLKEGDDLFDRILTALEKEAVMARKEVVAAINAIRARMGIYAEVAALILGARLGADISTLLPEVEELLRSRRPSPADG